MTTSGKILSGFLVGTAVGATLGILYAPKKGSKTRILVAEKAKELKDTAGKTYHHAKEALGLEKSKDNSTTHAEAARV